MDRDDENDQPDGNIRRLSGCDEQGNNSSVFSETSYTSEAQGEEEQIEQIPTAFSTTQPNDEAWTSSSSSTPFEGFTKPSPTTATTEIGGQAQPRGVRLGLACHG